MYLLPIIFFAVLVGVVLLRSTLRTIPSKDRWPPISDDEFIRCCSPGVNRERALKVRRIISEQLGVDYERVYPEQRFVEDLGCE